MLLTLGKVELKIGQEESAIEHLRQSQQLAESSSPPPPAEILAFLSYELGIGYMRVGETQNCCQRYTPESCILPIQGEGIHQQQQGSRNAIEQFTKALTLVTPKSPVYAKARWMLNLAYMTVGEHPAEVPAAYLIPLEAFESDEPFPRFKNISADLGLATFSWPVAPQLMLHSMGAAWWVPPSLPTMCRH